MRKTLMLLGVSLFISVLTFGQARKVSGKITNEKGEPIPYATVKVKGKTEGVSADGNGNYSITVNAGDILLISSTNISNKEIKVGTSDVLNVQVDAQDAVLSEVVVTALGIKREKRQLATATQTINADQLNKSGSGNPLSELNGKASGLTVINSAGDPGSGTYIRLRGVTSITGNNQPLMVVDGVPIDNSINNYDPGSATPDVSGANSNLTAGTQPTNRGVDINPNDIESITLLKGPAATALYGIQAASGALIITTKKGGAGQRASVTVNSSVTFDRVNKLPKRQNLYSQGDGGEYAGPETGARLTWGAKIDTLYRDGIANEFDRNGNIVGASDPTRKTRATVYDPYDFFQTGMTYNNSVALSGGTAKSGFRLSLGNISQSGIIPKAKYDKATMSLSGQTALNDKFSISGSVNFIHSNNYKIQQGSNTSGIMLGLLRTPTTFDNSNGFGDKAPDTEAAYVLENGVQRTYRGGPGYDNPYWVINRNPFREELNRSFGFAQANYQLKDWISFTYRLGGDVYSQDAKNAFDIGSNAFSNGALHLSDYFNKQFNSDFTVSLKKDISDKFKTSLLLGHNYFTYTNRARLTHGSKFILPGFYDMLNITSFTSDEITSKKRTMAFYAEAHLDFDEMLFLTLTGRRETSSTLPSKNNSFFYPSASLAFEFTKLPVFSGSDILNYGKLRLSAAQVGKDAPVQGLDTYYSKATVSDGFTTGIQFPISDQPGFQYSSSTSVIGNPDLKAEKTNSYEIGADLNFFRNRVTLGVTGYYSKSSNVILTAPIAYSTGFASKLLNAAVIKNTGLEVTLSVIPVKAKDFTWDLTFNWSKNKNKVTSLAAGVDKVLIAGFTNGEIDAIAGKAFGQIYGNIYVRSDPSDMNSPLLINDDPSKDGYGMPIVSSQSAAIGDINPDWNGSVINTLTYKNFNLGFQIDVRQGGDIWNGTRGAMSYFGTSEETGSRGATTVFKGLAGHLDESDNVVHFAGGNEVAKPGGENAVTATYNQYYWQNLGSSFIGPAEASVEDGSFVRIRQISLGYNIPKSVLQKIRFSNASLTFFANNPVLWTKYKGVDPETSLAGPANGQGLDYFNNPGSKSYGVRLNVTL